jgi:hypothetical protein
LPNVLACKPAGAGLGKDWSPFATILSDTRGSIARVYDSKLTPISGRRFPQGKAQGDLGKIGRK